MSINREEFLHDWIVEEVKKKYTKEFNEIKINTIHNNENDFKGLYPDIIFGNYGQVVMIGEVETESNISEKIIPKWKELQGLNTNCLIFVPKSKLKLTRNLCFENQLIDRIKILSFSVEIPLS
tara:strand:- start:6291 stop:6659 length:369 start_codon:yes stop_codon:yes gene_type:complete